MSEPNFVQLNLQSFQVHLAYALIPMHIVTWTDRCFRKVQTYTNVLDNWATRGVFWVLSEKFMISKFIRNVSSISNKLKGSHSNVTFYQAQVEIKINLQKK